MTNKVEVLAPVGSWESLAAAIQAKADAIYFGLKKFNMRSHGANNFSEEELPEIVKTCKAHNIKSYLTLNSIVYDEEVPIAKKICDLCKAVGVDAVIASDLAVITYAHSIGLPVHLSTQVNISNSESLLFFSKFADTIVLARELSLEQIQTISNFVNEHNVKGPSGNILKLEIFVHGALCVAIAGKCYMSLAQYNTSANRGECFQACRRKYRVLDEETSSELVIDNHYVMSPKDLCTIANLDQILKTGVSLLKIEGRGRSADYVFATVKAYKEAVQSVFDKTYTQEKIAIWKSELERVYNRGFWEGGYYLNKKGNEWSGSYGSQATCKKVYAGKVINYFSKLQVVEVKQESASLKEGDHIMIMGATTGVIEHKITNLHQESSPLVTFALPQKVRKNDKVYLIHDSNT